MHIFPLTVKNWRGPGLPGLLGDYIPAAYIARVGKKSQNLIKIHVSIPIFNKISFIFV